MFNLSKYLEGFSKKVSASDSHKKTIIEILAKNTGLNLSSENIEIKENTIYIKDSPAIKNKIFINKKSILDDTTLLLPDIKIIDIR